MDLIWLDAYDWAVLCVEGWMVLDKTFIRNVVVGIVEGCCCRQSWTRDRSKGVEV